MFVLYVYVRKRANLVVIDKFTIILSQVEGKLKCITRCRSIVYTYKFAVCA